MAIIDEKSGALVIRLVYDGPPFSGKTTSLRSLAQGLGVTVETPSERDGRTLFFDWLEYSGGLFDGRRIRCQLVSVPGQTEFAERRQALLASADAVIVVANTRECDIGGARDLLDGLVEWTNVQQPPVGLIIQANQRDQADCVPSRSLRERLAGTAPIAIVETVATAGAGVREAFVLGVRLALDRVRALTARGELSTGVQSHDTPAELLAHLQQLEARLAGPDPVLAPPPPKTLPPPTGANGAVAFNGPRASIAASAPPSSLPAPAPAPVNAGAFVPDPTMPGGFIWPPVHGRTFLHEVAQLSLELNRAASGDWSASGEGWRVHSRQACEFASTDEGRPALIDWARVHATNDRRLSPGRAVILSPWTNGSQRLWQLVRLHPSLREALAIATDSSPAVELAEALLDAASHLGRAQRSMWEGGLGVRCTLWTVSAELDRPPVYVGLMPHPNAVPESDTSGDALIEREFGPFLAQTLALREDGPKVVAELVRQATTSREAERASLSRLARNWEQAHC